MKSANQILRNHKLKSTATRAEVLSVLMDNDHALSHADLEREMSTDCDRVTLYRTLKTFQEKGLIHKVLDDSGITKYAPCSECTTETHQHEHVHFKCENCGNTVCIEDLEIPPVKLPVGFSPREQNLLITGICNICNKN